MKEHEGMCHQKTSTLLKEEVMKKWGPWYNILIYFFKCDICDRKWESIKKE